MSGPLEGRTLLVTRAAEDAEVWAAELRRRGARPLIVPCLSSETSRDEATCRELAVAVAASQWLVLPSRRAVAAVHELLGSIPPHLSIAVVGPATAAAARDHGLTVDLVAPQETARSLGEALAAHLVAAGQPLARVVVAGAQDGRRDVEEVLAAQGVPVTRSSVYRTLPVPASEDPLDLVAAGVDAVLLASPSAVRGLVGRTRRFESIPAASIGPTTTEAARTAGLSVVAEASQRSLAGLLAALEENL